MTTKFDWRFSAVCLTVTQLFNMNFHSWDSSINTLYNRNPHIFCSGLRWSLTILDFEAVKKIFTEITLGLHPTTKFLFFFLLKMYPVYKMHNLTLLIISSRKFQGDIVMDCHKIWVMMIIYKMYHCCFRKKIM